MLSEEAKRLIADLDLELCPVAIKFSPNIPDGYERNDDDLMICKFVRDVQATGHSYYIDVAEKPCMGKNILGIEPFSGTTPAGMIGWECGIFGTPAANAHLYHEIKTLYPGACNYVVFAPLQDCTFDPDLIIFVAPTDTAFTIMRAASWYTGDVWESTFTQVLSCAWMYPYPYVTGKINMLPTCMQLGQRKSKLYEPGQLIICVPFQKIDAVVKGLKDMDMVPLTLREDQEGIDREAEVMRQVEAMERDKTIPCSISERL